MQKVKMIVNCASCGEEIVHTLSSMDDEISVHIMNFHDSWECLECAHTTLFADLEGIDEADL